MGIVTFWLHSTVRHWSSLNYLTLIQLAIHYGWINPGVSTSLVILFKLNITPDSQPCNKGVYCLLNVK
jgi:hypothetical protein